MGTGAAAIITEAIVDNSNKGTGQSLTGGVLTLGGAILSLTSIPVFINSSKNKRRAAALAVNNSKINLPQGNSNLAKNHFSISLRLPLN